MQPVNQKAMSEVEVNQKKCINAMELTGCKLDICIVSSGLVKGVDRRMNNVNSH